MIVRTGPITLPCDTTIARYLRVKMSGGYLAAAGATDNEIGTLEAAILTAGDRGSVVPRAIGGTRFMIAAGAFSQYAAIYGAAGGKVDDVSNENYVGIALQAATTVGDIIEVMPNTDIDEVDNLGDINGNVVLDEDFLWDWPAAATALNCRWTKTETLGLGVIDSDEANGVVKCIFDAVAEAATAAIYLDNSPFDVDTKPIVEFILGVFDIGDDAALDINFGIAVGTHATDADSITESVFFHLDGTDLTLNAESDDGTTEVAAADTGLTLVDDQYGRFKIDCSDLSDIKLYAAVDKDEPYVRVLSGTTFKLNNATGPLTPIVHVEKTNNDTTADVRVDRIRVQANRKATA